MNTIDFNTEVCPKCKSKNVKVEGIQAGVDHYRCIDCNMHWMVTQTPLRRAVKSFKESTKRFIAKWRM